MPLVACSALATAALASQGLCDVRRDQELCGLYLMLVGVSGERKSSSDREFTKCSAAIWIGANDNQDGESRVAARA